MQRRPTSRSTSVTERKSKPYVYGERSVENMSERAFRFGQGRISGYLSTTLGLSSLLAVLCFRYPRWLTTGELRETYDVDLLRLVLRISIWAAFAFGLYSFVRYERKRLGA